MENVVNILNEQFKIAQITIDNFTVLGKQLLIRIKIDSGRFNQMDILFEGVSGIRINPDYYTCTDRSSITIEDLSHAQMQDKKYRIAISEDAMSFYCLNISDNSEMALL